ncbi:MAG: hypothetical protein L6W00_13285 [Lentisphaeria bacterium]|nr:MAG: hypothetical protein L6W00_13285 [Lentisphaeria bacterium]
MRKNSGRNPYPALEGSGLYGGRVEVTLASGEALTITRQGPGTAYFVSPGRTGRRPAAKRNLPPCST